MISLSYSKCHSRIVLYEKDDEKQTFLDHKGIKD